MSLMALRLGAMGAAILFYSLVVCCYQTVGYGD